MNHSTHKRTVRAGILLLAMATFLVIVAFISTMDAATSGTRTVAAVFDPRPQPSALEGRLVLANSVMAAQQVNTPTIFIVDDDITVVEGQDVVIEIEIDPPKVGDSGTVDYRTVPDTATAGIDYISQSGTLEWVEGPEVLKIVRVATRNRSGYQGDREFTIVLDDPDGLEFDDPDVSGGDVKTIDVTILDDESPPQETPTKVFVDRFEPNNTLASATQVAVGVDECDLTLWPSGDIDYFAFYGKQGFVYTVETSSGSTGSNLDTELTVYDTNGNRIGNNDDAGGTRFSEVEFTASGNGNYYAKVVNKNPADSADNFYCFEVTEVLATPTPTKTPAATTTRVPGADGCEWNGEFESACLIGAGETFNVNFVPAIGDGPDNDFYRIWVKPGLFYDCETFDLSPVNDTNMILYDQNHNGIGGNDDKGPGDFGSQVGYLSSYTGWLYVLVGPVTPIDYADSFLYTYSLRCTETVATPTATPTNTRAPFTGGVVPRPPTATPIVATATETPFTTAAAPATLTPTPTPNIQIVPLPTNTPPAVAQGTINIDLTVYFDSNMNFTAELTEGVQDVAVAIYDTLTSELLAFGYTNEAGAIRFSALSVSGPVRISIPFLQYSQTTSADTATFIRIAPYVQSAGPS